MKPPPDAAGRRTGRRIVVAEDDPEMRRVLSDALTADGHDVLAVDDGGQLVMELAQNSRYNFDKIDLIVTDARMPRCSGLQAAETILALRARIRIVMVTAFPDAETHARAQKLGVTILEKPFSMDRLRTTVWEALTRDTPS